MSKTPPVRTCVGCRERVAKSDLLRVVGVVSGGAGTVLADDLARRPGRGAYVHRSPECLDLAERRRAFPRALRLVGPLDTSALRAAITATGRPSPEEDR